MPIEPNNPVSAAEMIEALNEKEEVYVGSTTPVNSNIKVWIDTESPSATLASLIYPVGSIYMSVNNTDPSILFGGTWVSIASGRVLMGVDASHGAGSTAEAGLPNITGSFGYGQIKGDATYYGNGALYPTSATTATGYGTNKFNCPIINLDASRSSSIYGKSTTVQPPAFYVYMWRRTA